MKPYIRQDVIAGLQLKGEIEPPVGYYLAFADYVDPYWRLIWAPYSDEPKTPVWTKDDMLLRWPDGTTR